MLQAVLLGGKAMAKKKTKKRVFLRDPDGKIAKHWGSKLEKDIEVDNDLLLTDSLVLFHGMEEGEKGISIKEMIARLSVRDDLQEIGQNNLDWLGLRENQWRIPWEWHQRNYNLIASGTIWSRINGTELSVALLWPYFTWSRYTVTLNHTTLEWPYRILCLDKRKIQ